MQPAATTNNLASPGFFPTCCVYPAQQLSGSYNNCLTSGALAATIGSYYGVRSNANICNQFCPIDILVPSGYSNSLAGTLPKAKLGDSIGLYNGRIIGNLSNTLIL